LDPDTDCFYEIIDTTIVNRKKKNGGPAVTVIAWPINADGEFTVTGLAQSDPITWQRRPYLEVQALLDLQLHVVDPLTDRKFPVEESEWTHLQLEDTWCAAIMKPLDGTNHYNLHPTGRNDDRHFDRLHRPLLVDDLGVSHLGPLTRSATIHHTINTGATEITRFTVIHQLVIPLSMQPSVLHQHHALLGHAGSTRMTKTTRLKYWWSSIVSDCTTHARQCRYCELRKANNRQPKIPIEAYPVPPSPHHTVAIDLTGPFKNSHGFLYILVYKCALTKWVECVPLTDKTADTVATALINIFERHGAPRRMVMDRGTEFKNKKIKAICALLDVHRFHITPVNPRSNGLAENFMRTLKDMLSAHVKARHDNWSEHLSAVAHIYNTTVNHATGYTPFYLNHGRQCATPDTDFLTTTISTDLDTHVQGLAQSLKLAWDTLGGSVWTDKTAVYNKRTVQPLEFTHYEPNQLVFIKRIPRRFYRDLTDEAQYALSTKLQARYSGPYRILRKKSDVVYVAMVHGKEHTIHAWNMKPAMVDLHVALSDPDPEAADITLTEDLAAETQQAPTIQRILTAPPQPDLPHREGAPLVPLEPTIDLAAYEALLRRALADLITHRPLPTPTAPKPRPARRLAAVTREPPTSTAPATVPTHPDLPTPTPTPLNQPNEDLLQDEYEDV
jgi:transposase InsO family protein